MRYLNLWLVRVGCGWFFQILKYFSFKKPDLQVMIYNNNTKKFSLSKNYTLH